MGYRILADTVVTLHLAFILYAALGGFLALGWPRSAWLHVPTALWAAAVEFAGWVCPLTHLENHFRLKAGMSGYPGGFIEHYLLPAIYPSGLTRSVQVGLALLVVAVNVAVYALVRRRYRSEDQA